MRMYRALEGGFQLASGRGFGLGEHSTLLIGRTSRWTPGGPPKELSVAHNRPHINEVDDLAGKTSFEVTSIQHPVQLTARGER